MDIGFLMAEAMQELWVTASRIVLPASDMCHLFTVALEQLTTINLFTYWKG